MSNIPPQRRFEQIIWFENHVPAVGGGPASFGVTAAMVTAVDTATQGGPHGLHGRGEREQASKNATTAQDMQVSSMLFVGPRPCEHHEGVHRDRHAAQSALWGQAGLEPNAGPEPRRSRRATTLSATLDSQAM